jgi:LysR family transcriptional activator of nhaA
MDWLNYHHLYYFWVVAREGSIVAASDRLRLAKATISSQIRSLEDTVGQRLFERRGRRLVLTDAGVLALRHAEEIFASGRRMLDEVRGQTSQVRLIIGITDALPKPIVRRLLEPALRLDPPPRLVCREDRPVSAFVDELASHIVDVVLADAPPPTSGRGHAYGHLLGECGTTLFAAPVLARRLRKGFPGSMSGAQWLVPGSHSALRGALEAWWQDAQIVPYIVAELDDAALMNTFGQDGAGVFAGPSVIAEDICRRYDVAIVGELTALRQRFYAITHERRLANAAVREICTGARRDLFG